MPDDEAYALILQRLDRIEEALAGLDTRFVRTDLVQVENRHQGERIGALELGLQSLHDDKKWLIRLVIGAVLLAILGMVVGGGTTW